MAIHTQPFSGSGGDGILVTGEKTESGWLTTKGAEISEAEITQHLANVVFGAYSKQLEDQALVEEQDRDLLRLAHHIGSTSIRDSMLGVGFR